MGIINNVKSVIKDSKWGGYLLNSFIYVYMRDVFEIKSILRTFHKHEGKEIIHDMVNERRKNQIPYNEYLLFKFDECKDRRYRSSFVSDTERVNIANELNLAENDPYFYDKAKTYHLFGKYYKRMVIRIDSRCAFDNFDSFVKKNKSFICKPIDGGCGVGIRIISVHENTDIKKLFRQLIEEYNEKCFAEELIRQVPLLSKLHPQSVNTVRMPTFLIGDTVKVLHPFLRVGQKGSITDNAGSGGIICPLDENGTVIAAVDEFGNSFVEHPDTKEKLIGFSVPKWDEALTMVKDLALLIPTNKYCSWDLALTDKGWVLVEANAKGQFIWQYATGIGFRKELDEILKAVG